LARKRNKHLTSATKSNGIIHTMPFWDERFHEMAAKFPDIPHDQFSYRYPDRTFCAAPDWFDVVVGSNIFGDISPTWVQPSLDPLALLPPANLGSGKRISVHVRTRPRLGAGHRRQRMQIP